MGVRSLRRSCKPLGRAGSVAVLVMLVVGCGSDGQSVVEAPTTQVSISVAPTTTPPLSAFEGDPAVKGLRAYLAAVAQAVNARDLQQSELLANSTPGRAASHQVVYGESLTSYLPGPSPVAVLGVQVTSDTARSISVCSPESGFALDKPGGKPVETLELVGGRFQMVLDSGRWKVDDAVADASISCNGVALQPPIE